MQHFMENMFMIPIPVDTDNREKQLCTEIQHLQYWSIHRINVPVTDSENGQK